MHAQIGVSDDYDTFSEDSANEIAADLQYSGYGGEACMAEFNGTTYLPHTEYACYSEGHCYKKEHSHQDGAILFIVFFFIYFIILSVLLTFPVEYQYAYVALKN